MENNQRNQFVDVVRGVGILIVVIGHNWITWHDKGLLFRMIFSFHMPLFFVLSGVLFKGERGFLEYMKSKFYSLMFPYFFVLTCVLLIKWSLGGRDSVLNLKPIIGMVYGTGNVLQLPQLWFLPSLFVTAMFSFFILTNFKRHISLYLVSALCIVVEYLIIQQGGIRLASVFGEANVGLPWSLDLLPITSAFFIFGYCFKVALFRISYFWLGFLLVLFAVLHYFFCYTIDLNSRVYESVFISTMEALAGIYCCFGISIIFCKINLLRNFFSYVGSRSLFVLIFHATIQSAAFNISEFLTSDFVYMRAIFSFLIGVYFSLLLYSVAVKFDFFNGWLVQVGKKNY